MLPKLPPNVPTCAPKSQHPQPVKPCLIASTRSPAIAKDARNQRQTYTKAPFMFTEAPRMVAIDCETKREGCWCECYEELEIHAMRTAIPDGLLCPTRPTPLTIMSGLIRAASCLHVSPRLQPRNEPKGPWMPIERSRQDWPTKYGTQEFPLGIHQGASQAATMSTILFLSLCYKPTRTFLSQPYGPDLLRQVAQFLIILAQWRQSTLIIDQ